MNAKQAQQAEARVQLLRELKPGDMLHTIVRHVARSGMSRHISVISLKDGEPSDITYLVARAGDYRRNQHDGGLVVSGCGMDMGFEVVYNLGRRLWPNGFSCPGDACRSNDHSNGDRNYQPHHHTDGGYALRQAWI